MDSNLAKSALLTTSAATDVKRSGGEVSITDLLSFDIDKMLAANQRIYRAEVQQVNTVDLAPIPPAALTTNTRYSIRIGNVLNEYEGGKESLQVYAFTSGAVIPTEAIIAQGIVDAINNTSISNYVSAVRVGDTIVITDDAGYYPVRPGGRAGPSTVTLGDGTASATITLTTAGVISYGDGTYIASNVPVKDPMTGNLTSGELDTPTGAVAGQFYDGFTVTYAKEVNHQAVSGLRAEKVLRQLIYVDNGTGASVANLAGYAAFLREFEKLIYHNYTKDPNSIVEFWESTAHLMDNTGIGVPTNGNTNENLVNIDGNQLRYICIGATPDDPVGSVLTAGGGFSMLRATQTNDMGIEYSAEVGALSPLEFVIGQEACSFKAQINIDDVSDTDDFLVGLRKKEAYQAAVDNYDEMAALNVISGDIWIETILNGAGTGSDDTTVNWADGGTHTLEVQVDTDGLCKFLIDDVDYSSVQTPAFSFDAGEVVIPFIHHLSNGGGANAILIQKWFSIADTLSY